MASRALGVRAAKIGLPVIAVGVLASIFLFSNATYDDSFSFDGVDVTALGEGLKLSNPRFTGATAKGEPFTITADWALPDGPDPENVELSKVSGELNLVDGRFITLNALGGNIRPKVNEVELVGSVAFLSSDGYELRAARAKLEADQNRILADGPINASGPMGRIEAGSLRVERRGADGDYIWFEKRVKVYIDRPNQKAQ